MFIYICNSNVKEAPFSFENKTQKNTEPQIQPYLHPTWVPWHSKVQAFPEQHMKSQAEQNSDYQSYTPPRNQEIPLKHASWKTMFL